MAHTITLVGAVLGAFSLPAWLVEPAIALTIVYIGVENFLIKNVARRWILAFAFGLVHGFGFAGILAETGLPREGRLLSLLSFNMGVEVGQLAVVLLVVPALAALRRGASTRALVAIAAVALVAAAALFALEPAAAIGLAVIAAGLLLWTPRWGYERVAVRGGSALVVLLGLIWFVRRLL